MDEVRIDKYLWAIRVYKTRTDATDACNGGKIRLNGADVKPSKHVKSGDMIVVRKGAVTYTYRVIEPLDKRQGAQLVPKYAENLTPQEELDKLLLSRLSCSRGIEVRAVLRKRTVARWMLSGKSWITI